MKPLPLCYRTLMGFDFGMKSIGIAIGQLITQSASSMSAIPAKQGIPVWGLLDKLIKEWQPEALIVGIPLGLDNTELTVTGAAREFALALIKRYGLPTYGIDEQLTTRSAKEELFADGGYKALKKANVDGLSAKIILETWFSRKPEQITIFNG